MKDRRIQHIFRKYLDNDCTDEELDELLDLVDQEDNTVLDDSLRQLWERKRGYTLTSGQIDWDTMQQRIVGNTYPQATAARLRNWYSYAAAILLISFSFGAYLWYKNQASYTDLLVESVVPIVQRDTVMLMDGSRVVLNSGSRLRYPERFSGIMREVYLEGEGYFEVAKDPSRPFIVHAGPLKTKVLGTSFNINAYAGQSKMEVSVLTGKVEVEESKSGRSVDLLPNEKVRYTIADDKFAKIEATDINKDLAWNTGRLAFEDAPLTDIVQQYYRRYGKKIEIESESLKSCRLSLVFDKESPQEILKMIALLTNAHVKEDGSTVILYGKGCQVAE